MEKPIIKPITKRMTIAEIISKYPETIPILMKHGMPCMGCPIAMQETLEQGLAGHGIDIEKIIEELNNAVKKKKKTK
jgi:hybrid cluster-associated redox disulfide protein